VRLMQPTVALLLIALPWLNPFAAGPTPAVAPWLSSVACGAFLLFVRPWPTPQTISSAWLLAALISSVVGLLQYFGHTQAFGIWVHATELGVAFGNLRQRNQFATLTSIGLLALLWQVAKSPQIQNGTGLTRGAALFVSAAAVLLALGNATSGSRTGFFQWLLVVALTVAWAPRDQRRLLGTGFGALSVYLLAVAVLPALLELSSGIERTGLMARFQEEPGCASRRVLWANVLHLIAQKPLLGWGWGELDYAHFVTLYPGERFCDILDNAHNLPLHLAVELGLPVAIVTCGGMLWFVVRNKPWNETDPTRQMAWGVLAMIGLHSLLEYPLWYGPFQMAALLTLGLLSRTFQSNCPLALARSSIIAIVIIAMTVFAAWDYWRISQLYLPVSERNPAYQYDTLKKVRTSWLFDQQVVFAELTTTTLTLKNASNVHELALQLLHFSPEPRVIERLIDSVVMLGRDDEAAFYLVRYRAAFPDAHLRWMAESAGHEAP
jgi:O-antigen ligase